MSPQNEIIAVCEIIDPQWKEKQPGNEFRTTLRKAKDLERKKIVKIKEIVNKNDHKFKFTNEKIEKENIFFQSFIPYYPNKKIGYCYNKIMNECKYEWILLIDHDVYLALNPFWYDICVNAINKCGSDAGWITCYTNRIKCKFQRAPNIDENNNDILYHRQYAKELYYKNNGKLLDYTNIAGGQFSGFFILTSRKAWQTVGGFNEEGFFTVDNTYFSDLKNAGFKLIVMSDLYVYHGYFRDSINNTFSNGVNNEM